MDLAQERGASSWLTSLPIEEFGFALHKGAFQDALALHYNWFLLRIPSNCACSMRFSVEHALSCSKGGFPSIRHNEIWDLTANLLTEVFNDVCIEPDLQPIDGEVLTGSSSNTQDGARLDIAANGFWGGSNEWHGQRSYCVLQEASLLPSYQVESVLQFNSVMAALPTHLFTTSVCHTVYQRCSLKLWTCGQVSDTTNWLGQLRTSFHLIIFFSNLFFSTTHFAFLLFIMCHS